MCCCADREKERQRCRWCSQRILIVTAGVTMLSSGRLRYHRLLRLPPEGALFAVRAVTLFEGRARACLGDGPFRIHVARWAFLLATDLGRRPRTGVCRRGGSRGGIAFIRGQRASRRTARQESGLKHEPSRPFSCGIVRAARLGDRMIMRKIVCRHHRRRTWRRREEDYRLGIRCSQAVIYLQ